MKKFGQVRELWTTDTSMTLLLGKDAWLLRKVWMMSEQYEDLVSVNTKSLGRVIPGIRRISKAGFSFAIGIWKEWNTYGNMGLHNNKGTKVKRWKGIDGGRLEDSAMYAETMRVKERRLLLRKGKWCKCSSNGCCLTQPHSKEQAFLQLKDHTIGLVTIRHGMVLTM